MAITIPKWPATLPAPLRDGYGYELDIGILRTQFSGGSIRQRRTVFGLPAAFSLSFSMTTKQLNTFHHFAHDFGFGWFAMDLVHGGAADWSRTGSDCLWTRVRFTSNPTFALAGPNKWRVNIAAEVQSMLDPRADPSQGESYLLVDDVTPTTVDELSDWDTLTV